MLSVVRRNSSGPGTALCTLWKRLGLPIDQALSYHFSTLDTQAAKDRERQNSLEQVMKLKGAALDNQLYLEGLPLCYKGLATAEDKRVITKVSTRS